jgi:hypothetical protein
MKTAVLKLTSVSPLTQSRKHNEPKLEKELDAAWDERTWKKKAHIDEKGRITIPAFAIKCAVVAAAKYSGDQIPGKGKSTWTKKFQCGLIIPEDAVTNRTEKDLQKIIINANADGVRGSGKRVERRFPQLTSWEANVSMLIGDEIITKQVLLNYFKQAGQFIGVGQYRPENGGTNGRFSVELVSYE